MSLDKEIRWNIMNGDVLKSFRDRIHVLVYVI